MDLRLRQSSYESCHTMDVFDSPYYRLNKYCLSFIGQWPYQSTLQKNIIGILVVILNLSITVPEIVQLADIWGNLDHVVDWFSSFAMRITFWIVLVDNFFNEDTVKVLLKQIHDDWKTGFEGAQLRILKKYAERGQKFANFYAYYVFGTLAIYDFLPLMPKFLDIVMPLNESRRATYYISAKYGNINIDEHYFLIVIHARIAGFVGVVSVVGLDTIYAVYIQHACGMIAALGYRLKHALDAGGDEIRDNISDEQQEEATYQALVTCVKMHKKAIEFVRHIESCHVVRFFFILGLTILHLSIVGYQIVANFNNPQEAFRYGSFISAQVVHMFYLSYLGQELIDHSERIQEWIYGSKWYHASTRSKKLLMIMIAESLRPSYVTAGKLYVISLQNFSMIIQTAVSYFTMLVSFR